VRRNCLCRRQAALHGASGAPRPQVACPQRHCATNHCLMTWRLTEIYGKPWRRRRRRCREDFILSGLHRGKTGRSELPAYVGARRPCTALLGQRVRKWNAHNVVAQTFAAYQCVASQNFTARNGESMSAKMPFGGALCAQIVIPL